jgi:gamma-glutamyl:cysteine ligase YbdK (ATP-grasp superfamily)
MHINLPFADDSQFARLHTAIRLVLPLIPALAASSPFADGVCHRARTIGFAVYATHMSRFPVITGDIIPDVVRSRREYEQELPVAMYERGRGRRSRGLLRHEWLNAHGANRARSTAAPIEIRLADVQECPRADIAVAQAVCAVVQSLYEERAVEQQAAGLHPDESLARLLSAPMRGWRGCDHRRLSSICARLAARASTRRTARSGADLLAKDAKPEGGSEALCRFLAARARWRAPLIPAPRCDTTRAHMRAAYTELCDCLPEAGRLLNPMRRSAPRTISRALLAWSVPCFGV